MLKPSAAYRTVNITKLPLNDSPKCVDREPNEMSPFAAGAIRRAKKGLRGDRNMDILLVDDSKTMRMILQRAIRQAGFRGLVVGEAGNGAQALEKLSAEQPKLILSDWNMPEMSGIDFLLQVRAAGNTVPFGFITSETSAGIKDLAMNSGATFLLSKPFTPEDVEKALTPILDR
jgi:two-component system chemotaxis response regulator CheY